MLGFGMPNCTLLFQLPTLLHEQLLFINPLGWVSSLLPRCLALASTLSHKPCTQDSESLQTSDLREDLPAAYRSIFDDHCYSSFYAFLAVYPTNKDLSKTNSDRIDMGLMISIGYI